MKRRDGRVSGPAAQRVFCSLTAADSKRASAYYQHAGVKVPLSSFKRFLLITEFIGGTAN
jgi:hypothetical protein